MYSYIPCLNGPTSSSKCLSKLSFTRVRKATAAFRLPGELVTPGQKSVLENEFGARGSSDFDELTTQVRPGPSCRVYFFY